MDEEPWDRDPIEQLPDVVEAGPIRFTLWTAGFDGEPVAHDISLIWDGNHTAEWHEDISSLNHDLSPMSSSPVWGIASWPTGDDVLLTYTWSDLGLQGHDRLPGMAPVTGDSSSATDPRGWIELGEALLGFVLSDLGEGGDTPDKWSAKYLDVAQDTEMDFHDVFRAFLEAVEHGGAVPDFDEWLNNTRSPSSR